MNSDPTRLPVLGEYLTLEECTTLDQKAAWVQTAIDFIQIARMMREKPEVGE